MTAIMENAEKREKITFVTWRGRALNLTTRYLCKKNTFKGVVDQNDETPSSYIYGTQYKYSQYDFILPQVCIVNVFRACKIIKCQLVPILARLTYILSARVDVKSSVTDMPPTVGVFHITLYRHMHCLMKYFCIGTIF